MFGEDYSYSVVVDFPDPWDPLAFQLEAWGFMMGVAHLIGDRPISEMFGALVYSSFSWVPLILLMVQKFC